MKLFEIIILSLVQGITEWLPISSSGHLLITQHLLKISVPIYYNILLHFATILVIIMVYYKEIWKILLAFSTLNFKNEYAKLGLYIIIASIPTAIIGFTFKNLILSFFINLHIVGIGLLATGIILLATKYFNGKRKISLLESIYIGTVQGLAILPGVSRSGATISSGLILGIRKELIATFSFLLSIPAILGASILEYESGIITKEILLAMALTVFIGYISLKFTIKLINQNKFYYFSPYCITVGILLIIYT
jgi:undecaprenyl-diphosphatase